MGIFNIKGQVIGGLRNELAKIDLNKNGVPDVKEAMDSIEASLDFFEHHTNDIDHDEWLNILQVYNSLRKPQNQMSPQRMSEVAISLSKFGASCGVIEQAVEQAEQALFNDMKLPAPPQQEKE